MMIQITCPCYLLHVHVIYYTYILHITYYRLHITDYMLHVTDYMLHITYHMVHITYSMISCTSHSGAHYIYVAKLMYVCMYQMAVMLMEALAPFPHKYSWSLVGHSGDI